MDLCLEEALLVRAHVKVEHEEAPEEHGQVLRPVPVLGRRQERSDARLGEIRVFGRNIFQNL